MPPRLVIEPFRTTLQTDPQFAQNTWAVLEGAICEIFHHNASHLSFEALYRSAYNMVLHKHGDLLYSNVRGTVEKQLDEQATYVAGKNDDEFLTALNGKWKEHKLAMQMIRDILLYMDRTYVDQNNKVPIFETGMELFQDRVARHPRIKERLLQMMLSFIQRERNGEMIDRQLAKSTTSMYVDISSDLYTQDFEAPFLASSETFYEKESQQYISTTGCPEYLAVAKKRLAEEEARVSHYMDPRTAAKIKKVVQDRLIRTHMRTLIVMENSGLVTLLTDSRVEDLALMYRLFRDIDGGANLMCEYMGKHLCEFGSKLVLDPENDKDPIAFTEALLDLKRKYSIITNEAFKSDSRGLKQYEKTDQAFLNVVQTAFTTFVNKNKKSPEYLSLFLDQKLRVGLKSATDEEANSLLEGAMSLFRYVEEKDVFEKYYRTHLTKRLLNNRSISDDLEKSFCTKLKDEAGQQYTTQIEGMFSDMRVSKDLVVNFRQDPRVAAARAERSQHADTTTGANLDPIDLAVNVLTTGCWPLQSPKMAVLPSELENCHNLFETYYLEKHTGRKLSWQTAMGSAEIRAMFSGAGKKTRTATLSVSTYQVVILLQFNNAASLSFTDLAAATKIPESDLKRNLQSLACVKKHMILAKEPAGREIGDGDIFKVNDGWGMSNKYARVKISTVSAAKEKEGERKETRKRVDADRQPLVEAAIVRIMKSRKSLDHNNLVGEVVRQLTNRFIPSPQFVKRRIESLIEREYLERSSGDKKVYNYLA